MEKGANNDEVIDIRTSQLYHPAKFSLKHAFKKINANVVYMH